MNKRILVIDDEEQIRKLFIRALEDTSYHVDTAESGEIGIYLYITGRYDLIFLDLTMPGMTGINTMREIRKINPDVPIFIITAFYKDYIDDITDDYEKGLKFEITRKPISIKQIVSITERTLKTSKVHQFVKNILRRKPTSIFVD